MINLNYISAGNRENPALIFLHGFLGSTGDWQEIMSDFSEDYFCLAFDLPGHGKSLIPRNYSDLNLYNTALELNVFLKKLDLNSPVIIGYSMGGRIALHMLESDELYWQGVILESASLGIENPDDRATRLENDLILATKLEMDDFNQFLEEWYSQPLFSGFVRVPDFENIFNRRMQNDPVQMSQALKAFSTGNQESFWHRLNKFEVPILIISGSNDEKYTSYTKRISDLYLSVRTQIISGAGHVAHAEKPREYIDIISQFISSLNR